MKKILSIILAILMIVTTVPMVFADDEAVGADGDCIRDNGCGYEFAKNEESAPDFSDAKVLSSNADGFFYIDGVKVGENSSGSAQLLPTGKYKLEGDIFSDIRSVGIKVGQEVVIDLNGYEWIFKGVEHITLEGELSLYDLSEDETGKIVAETSWGTVNIQNESAVFNLYGGTVESTSKYSLRCLSGKTNLYGGKLKSYINAIQFSMLTDNKGLYIGDTVFEIGDGYPHISCSGSINSDYPGEVFDISDYTGDCLTVELDICYPGKYTIFKGVKNVKDADKYIIEDVICGVEYGCCYDKTEYDEATGEISVYIAPNDFTQQPSADNNYTVTFNNTAASFQWYEAEEKKIGVYTADKRDTVLFKYDFKAGDILKASTDSDIEAVALSMKEAYYLELNEYIKTAYVQIQDYYMFEIKTRFLKAENPVDIEFSVIRETLLDGETGKTLQNPECGKTYYCKATVGEKVYVSDIVIGHSLVQVEAKAPTCKDIGWNAYGYCTACDYLNYVEISATGEHIDADGDYKCDYNCGYEYEKPKDKICKDCGEVHSNIFLRLICKLVTLMVRVRDIFAGIFIR